MKSQKPKVLFNCTTNRVGGAVQNAANFIRLAEEDSGFLWVYAVSPQVAIVLKNWGIHPKLVQIFETPARNRTAQKTLSQYAKDHDVDAVYTMAGPAYVRFEQPHFLGISNPYITHAGLDAIVHNRTPIDSVILMLSSIFRGVVARIEAQHWIFQTETSRNGFCKRFHALPDKTSIIPNAIGAAFTTLGFVLPSSSALNHDKVKIFCPSADYPHKNLLIIPEILKAHKELGTGPEIEFVVTIPFDSKTWTNMQKRLTELNLFTHVTNIGPYLYTDAAGLYEASDIVFIPSILETFSTSYLEAMATLRPLVVANKGFAREICSEFAEYFDPHSAVNALQAITRALKLTTDQLVAARRFALDKYGPYETRFNGIIHALQAALHPER